MTVLIVLLAIAALLVVSGIGIFNSLVGLRQQVRNAWSQIDVQLKRRYDLIPNLVESVKGYAKHEQETLERVINARNAAIAAHGVGAQAQAENALTGALRQLFALAEAYPDLKANQNFAQLQEELTSTENRIAFARQHYNDTVATYNTRVQSFPAALFATPLGFRTEEFFVLQDAAQREAPKVSF